MNSTRNWAAMPATTVSPSKVGVGQTETVVVDMPWRPSQWIGEKTDERMQQVNDAILYQVFDEAQTMAPKVSMTNPVINWRLDTRIPMFTKLLANLTDSGTTITVKDPLLFKPGWKIVFPRTNQSALVTAVNNDTGVVTIDRTFIAGPRFAAVAGDEVRAGMPVLGELGEPKEGINEVPGEAKQNFVEFGGIYTLMSKAQKASLMGGDYGTHQHLLELNRIYIMQAIQSQMLFGRKGFRNLAGEGPVWMTDGIIAQLGTNVFDVGTFAGWSFEELSNFCDGLNESRNSSGSKKALAGEAAFRMHLDSARAAGKVLEEVHFDANYAVDSFTFSTGGGMSVTVLKAKYAMEGELRSYTLILDAGNIMLGEYAEFGWGWHLNLEEGQMGGITRQRDAFVGSLCPIIIDPDTCGLLVGSSESTVTTNQVGPIKSL